MELGMGEAGEPRLRFWWWKGIKEGEQRSNLSLALRGYRNFANLCLAG